jgi:hypothetical protein
MTKEEHMDGEASFDNTDLEELAARVKRVLDIRDRKYGFPSKTYPNCFVGSEAVAQLVQEGLRNSFRRGLPATKKTPCASAT